VPTEVTLKELLEAGVHFGHQTRRWNPKMKGFIFGERSGIYIIDLQKSLRYFQAALRFTEDLAVQGKSILFIGTKRQAREVVTEEAIRCGMPYVTERWLGGLLTNFATIRKSLERIKDLEILASDSRQDHFTKKELGRFAKERHNLERNFRGIRNMKTLPDAVFVIDTRREAIAVREARKLRIPVIGIVDTNCDPDEVDVAIPGNDDALRAIRLYASRLGDAVIAGTSILESKNAAPEAEASAEPSAPAPAPAPKEPAAPKAPAPAATPTA